MIFDPNAGDATVLVATIANANDAILAGRRRDEWERELADYRQERETRSLMHQRHGVCG